AGRCARGHAPQSARGSQSDHLRRRGLARVRNARRGVAVPRSRRRVARGPDRRRAGRTHRIVTPVWLVLPDPFSSRLFFDTGIVERLRDQLGERLELFLLDAGEHADAWAERAGAIPSTRPGDLVPQRASVGERPFRRADGWIDRRIRVYPPSLRHSLRNGFHRERMQPGHSNWFLDPTLAGPLPRWSQLDPLMQRWNYGRTRYIATPLRRRLKRERPAIALANMQMH